jgi:hypothetical protein
MSMKNPAHPGNFIRMEIIEPAGFSFTAAAGVLEASRPGAVQPDQRKDRFAGRYSAADQGGVWNETGHSDAHAGCLRHCADAEAREPDSGEACQPIGTRLKSAANAAGLSGKRPVWNL